MYGPGSLKPVSDPPQVLQVGAGGRHLCIHPIIDQLLEEPKFSIGQRPCRGGGPVSGRCWTSCWDGGHGRAWDGGGGGGCGGSRGRGARGGGLGGGRGRSRGRGGVCTDDHGVGIHLACGPHKAPGPAALADPVLAPSHKVVG